MLFLKSLSVPGTFCLAARRPPVRRPYFCVARQQRGRSRAQRGRRTPHRARGWVRSRGAGRCRALLVICAPVPFQPAPLRRHAPAAPASRRGECARALRGAPPPVSFRFWRETRAAGADIASLPRPRLFSLGISLCACLSLVSPLASCLLPSRPARAPAPSLHSGARTGAFSRTAFLFRRPPPPQFPLLPARADFRDFGSATTSKKRKKKRAKK